ncbi:uncharacterized protein LOC133201578 [Saccostrea echinata]|uniref:uncharacterized protein LOC133201578 n=1 Tax=Saccostrea echinata TaxID=191078 RepID=UPI002A805541|nr:uncharacterized protein LOC133201578 [Saccostrea echinata]
MAFLCPSRVGRGTKEKKRKVTSSPIFGRITGSDSVDTLVRVGLEKQHGLPPNAKMVVLQDFTPQAEREMEVKRGQEVFQLYKDKDWSYVITVDGREGFIPESYCLGVSNSPSIQSKPKSKDLPWNSGEYKSFDSFDSDSFFSCTDDYVNDVTDNAQNSSALNPINVVDYQNVSVTPEVRPFRKTSHGHFIVLFDFTAQDENDVSVERAELIDVLNIEDPDWSWIRRGNGEEGFVPKSYICPVEPLKAQEKMLALQNKQKRTSTPTIRQPLLSNLSPRRYSQSSEPPALPQRNPLRTAVLRSRYNELDQESNYSDTQKEQHRSNSANKQNVDKFSVLRSPLATSSGVKRSNSPSRVSRSSETIYQGDNSTHSPPLIVYDKPFSQRVSNRAASPQSVPMYSEPANQNTRQRARSASPASSVGYENERPKSALGTNTNVNFSVNKSSVLSLSDQNLYKRNKQSDEGTNKYNSFQNLSSGTYSVAKDEHSGMDISNLQSIGITNQSNSLAHYNNINAGITNQSSSLTHYSNVDDIQTGSSLDARHTTNGNLQTFSKGGSELVMMYSYNDENRGGLNVKRGELIYANGADQQGTDWLWVFYPQTNQYGYVPRNYVKSTQLKTTL